MMKRRDAIIILLWPILASLLSFFLRANTLASTLLFFGAPAAYLSYRNRHCIKMVFIFSFLFSIPSAIILDYIMEITGGWYIPSSVFDPVRLFGYVTIEQLIWLFLFVYLVAMFYEVFLHKRCTHRLYYPKMKYLFLGLVIIFCAFVIIHLTKHSLLQIDYFYLKFGIVLGLIPIAMMLFNFPNLYKPFFITAAYFFYLSFIYEITALSLAQWHFPAQNQFIGALNIFGVTFPFEEFLFWIMLGAIGVLSYYRYFGEKP